MLNIAPPNHWPTRTTSSTSAALGAGDATLICTNTSDATVSLPSAAGVPFQIYTIKKGADNTATVTVTPDGSETIDGADDYVLYVVGDYVTIHSDGSNWHVIGGYLAPHTCLLVRSETQEGVAHATATKILYDTAAADNAGLADIANSRAIIRRDGQYQIVATVWIGAGGGNLVIVDSRIDLNSTQLKVTRAQMRSVNNFDGAATTIYVGALAAGDIIEGLGRHNGGADKNILANSTQLSIVEVR